MHNRSQLNKKEANGLTDGSLEEVFHKLYDPLLYFATRYVPAIEIAEEIVSDSFILFWKKKSDFSNYHQIRSFLYICTKNACLNHIRKSKNIRIIEGPENIESILQDDTDLLAHIIRIELLELVNNKINHLPEKQREVFRLAYIEDLTHEEISTELQISVAAVYIHKSRALRFLKKNIKLDYFLLVYLFGHSNF
ncbi:RNA polymerase sigma-70 factor [Sphingobacterium gobiense]|uniref:RNA polymerase sigma-70 factor n=1 Tax=Sphingobacterium gobiense TaxID=1382456 RepID=A0A2S9JS83_9SPHI|nr:RNA polymerase sigma-70 factor [Sphingobacterium gobiense]PRD56104.1 hypothetical protein C5749_02150 [Sphingobacterium gobiense]